MTKKIFKRSAALMAIVIAIVLAFAALTTLVGCGSKVTITGIDKTTATIDAKGSVTLTVELSRELEEGEVIEWTSSDTAVATVANGKVTGVAGGTATITASINETKAECVVTVNDKYEFSLASAFATIDLGATDKTATLKANALKNGEADANATVTWASSDETIATVSGGVVTGVANGTATITATCHEQTATCKVYVGTYAAMAPQNDPMSVDSWYRFANDETSPVPTLTDGKLQITGATRMDLLRTNENDNWVSIVDQENNFKTSGTGFYGHEYLYDVAVSATGNFDLIFGATASLPAIFNDSSHRGVYLYFTDGKVELKKSGASGGAVQATAEYAGKVTEITSVTVGITRINTTDILFKLFVNGAQVELKGEPNTGSIQDGCYLNSGSVNASNGFGQRFCVVPGENTTVTISSLTIRKSV